MKKQKIKSLRLNKKSISNFNSSTIFGGDNRFESVRICPVVLTETCSVNNTDCNTGTGGGGSATFNNCTVGCDTRLQDTCGCVDPVGTSNLASPC
ncbi:hypothetical protein [Kordia jejudonensis]|uniref:hypothetical protein n=1 Tax=Kordia jejudonensis TaxID=1348245 RepID=UPI000629A4C8|nr:hypothetical protein [Kordia jejudonensis]